jgi:hypothetical protein
VHRWQPAPTRQGLESPRPLKRESPAAVTAALGPDPMAEAHAILNVPLGHAGVAGPTHDGEQVGIARVPGDSGMPLPLLSKATSWLRWRTACALISATD